MVSFKKDVLAYEHLPLTGDCKVWEGPTVSARPVLHPYRVDPSSHCQGARPRSEQKVSLGGRLSEPKFSSFPIHHSCMRGPKLFKKSDLSF